MGVQLALAEEQPEDGDYTGRRRRRSFPVGITF